MKHAQAVLVVALVVLAAGRGGVSASARVESTGNSAANAANWRGFAAWLAKRAAAGKFSGAVLIARDGKRVVKQANGFADRQRKRPNTVDTKFKEPLQFQPGSRFGYSNSGYVALGAIIEAVTGQNYYDYVREHVFKPAGMKQTGWYSPGQVPNMAHGYTQVDTSGTWVAGNPSGGVYSTVGDLLRFAQALIKRRLLSPR
jgi:CubicO group peptidase (beta-lactamase class C family)